MPRPTHVLTAAAFRRLRRELNMTRPVLARHLFYASGTIKAWELDIHPIPDDVLPRLRQLVLADRLAHLEELRLITRFLEDEPLPHAC